MQSKDAKFQRIPISILMPVKNGEPYLQDSISNIEICTGPQDQIVVVNDFSSDNTEKILSNWQKEDSRVIFVQSQKPGLANALNLGLQFCENEWIARFDVDDTYPSDRLDYQSASTAKDVGAIFSDYSAYGNEGEYLGLFPSPITSAATTLSLYNGQRTAHSSALINRSAINSVGGYLENHFPAEDLSLWLRLAKVSKLITVPKTLMYYRIHGKSVTSHQQELMRLRKKELIENIGISDLIFQEVAQHWGSTISDYKKFTYSNERELLLFYDLVCATRFNKIKVKNLFSLLGLSLTLASEKHIWRNYKSLKIDSRRRGLARSMPQ